MFIEDISKFTVSNKMCNEETVKLSVVLVFCMQNYGLALGQCFMCIKLHNQHRNDLETKDLRKELSVNSVLIIKVKVY